MLVLTGAAAASGGGRRRLSAVEEEHYTHTHAQTTLALWHVDHARPHIHREVSVANTRARKEKRMGEKKSVQEAHDTTRPQLSLCECVCLFHFCFSSADSQISSPTTSCRRHPFPSLPLPPAQPRRFHGCLPARGDGRNSQLCVQRA